MQYNAEHGITPTPIGEKAHNELAEIYGEKSEQANTAARKTSRVAPPQKPVTRPSASQAPRPYLEEEHPAAIAADPVEMYMSTDELQRRVEKLKRDMIDAARRTDFIEAAQLRDELVKTQALLESKTVSHAG